MSGRDPTNNSYLINLHINDIVLKLFLSAYILYSIAFSN